MEATRHDRPTTTETRYGLVHLVRVHHDDRTRSLGYRPECLCGWSGTYTARAGDAEAAALAHRDEAPGLPDGLDATMSALLDLQDDLAEVVVWLAENWSADLPVPTPMPRRSTPAPMTDEDAAGVRAARLLPDAPRTWPGWRPGSVPRCVTHEGPNTGGSRYARAVRDVRSGAGSRPTRAIGRRRRRDRPVLRRRHRHDLVRRCPRRPALGVGRVGGVCGHVPALQRRPRL